MMHRRGFLVTGVGALAAAAVARRGWWASAAPLGAPAMVSIVDFDDSGKRLGKISVAKVVKSDAEWRQALPSELAYQVTRHADTEVPFSGQYNDFYKPGIYRCICCGTAQYSSTTKYDPKEGWPSFWDVLAHENIVETKDYSVGMLRTAVSCTRCDAHLGHVFDDGPPPTGLRYCMNSVSLRFVPKPA